MCCTLHGFGFAQAKFTIGPTAFVDGARVHKLLGDIEHNGEWYYIDIPFSVLRQCADNNDVFPEAKGGAAAYNDNHFWCLSGGVAGSELHIDNIFLYKDSTITPPEPQGKKGDVTGDDQVDIADVNAIIDMMLGKAEKVAAADVTGDNEVDIADVNAVIDLMLGK